MRNLLALCFLYVLSIQLASALERHTSIDGWWESNDGPQVRINSAPPRFTGSRIYFAMRGKRLCAVENMYFAGAQIDSTLHLGHFFNGKGAVYENRVMSTIASERIWRFADPIELYIGSTNLIFRKLPEWMRSRSSATFYLFLQRTTQLPASSPDYSGGFVPEKHIALVNAEDVCKRELSIRVWRHGGETR